MAKKFKIANAATFSKEVKIPRVGGEAIPVTFEFRYFDRVALGEMFTRWKDEASFDGLSDDPSLAEITEREIEYQVQQLKEVLVGWNFDDEFNDENIAALVCTSVQTHESIMKAYTEAYAEYKAGN